MSVERATYLDSSAIVKLAMEEPESAALRRFLGRRRVLISSALAQTEVARALLPSGAAAVRRGVEVIKRIDLVRVSDRVLRRAGELLPIELRSLDAIHIATVEQLGGDVGKVVTYDARLADGVRAIGYTAVGPT